MDIWIWLVLAGTAFVAVAAVWWKRRARRVYVIDHVRVEMHPACVVEDRVVEQVWRAAISMTNTSRRPRVLPVFAERATVQAGRRAYLARAYLDADVAEANPGEVALVWLEFVLPTPHSPRVAEAAMIWPRTRMLTLVCLPGASRTHRGQPVADATQAQQESSKWT